MTLLFGLAALAILLWAAQKYLQADPRKLAAVLKLSGGIALLGFAAFLALRGQIGVAAPLAAAFAERRQTAVGQRRRCAPAHRRELSTARTTRRCRTARCGRRDRRHA